MNIANRVVEGLLRSPLHRLLSGSTDLITYTGRRSGRTFTTPTQYARHGDEVVILVGSSGDKTWWRNFRDAERPVELLLDGRWEPMAARAIVGADDAAAAKPLLDAYVARFPRAVRSLADGTADERVQHAVLVRCRPR